MRIAILAALFLASAPVSHAAVTSAQDGGFHVEAEATVAASPSAVWRMLLRPSRWWSPDHTYSGAAANLHLEPRPGGCFCERLATGGVEHLRVGYMEQPKELRLLGGLGPLQGMADGALTFKIEPAEAGAVLRLSYRVWGNAPGGFGGIAPAVDGVLVEQLGRLKAAAEAQ